ncbi:MAG TPA: hypothetical protein VHK27_05610 [Gammaproteobacteria bacterium]|nr:hypothetical protein [Gammaproteobacteria bacterium]
MSGEIIAWIVGGLMAIFGLGGLYIKGKNDGKKVEKAKQDEINRKAEQKHDATVDKAKDVADDVERLPASDVEQRLRDKYTRD